MDAAVITAIIAAAGSFVLFLADRFRAARERKREKAAEAVGDALRWIEMPYRVARRVDDSPATIHALAQLLHELQERHLFQQAWMRVEVPDAYETYVTLLRTVRTQVAPHLQDAWRRPPIAGPAEMNLGNLYPVDVEEATRCAVEDIRDALRWRRL